MPYMDGMGNTFTNGYTVGGFSWQLFQKVRLNKKSNFGKPLRSVSSTNPSYHPFIGLGWKRCEESQNYNSCTWIAICFCKLRRHALRKLKHTLEHTPDPQLGVYEGNPFIFVCWGTWGMFQGSVGIFLDMQTTGLPKPELLLAFWGDVLIESTFPGSPNQRWMFAIRIDQN